METKALVLRDTTRMDWDRLERMLHDRFGVNAVTLTPDGDRHTTGDIPWANGICERIKRHPEGARRICDPLKRYLLNEVGLKKRMVAEECAAGMYRLVVPVYRKDALEGFVSVCGRPFSTADRIYTGVIEKAIDENAQTIDRLLPSLNPLDPRTLKDMRHAIAHFAG